MQVYEQEPIGTPSLSYENITWLKQVLIALANAFPADDPNPHTLSQGDAMLLRGLLAQLAERTSRNKNLAMMISQILAQDVEVITNWTAEQRQDFQNHFQGLGPKLKDAVERLP